MKTSFYATVYVPDRAIKWTKCNALNITGAQNEAIYRLSGYSKGQQCVLLIVAQGIDPCNLEPICCASLVNRGKRVSVGAWGSVTDNIKSICSNGH